MATERKFKDKKEYSRWYYQNYGKYGKKKGRLQRDPYAYARAAQGLASRMIRQNPVTASSSIAAHTIAGGVAAGYDAAKKSAFGKEVSSITKKAKKKGRKIYNRIRKLF